MMANIKTNGKANRPRFKMGDFVSFLFGSGIATGRIVEDQRAASESAAGGFTESNSKSTRRTNATPRCPKRI